MYQEGHIEIDFNKKQAVMALQKAKAPPPPLDEDEQRTLVGRLADNIGNAAKAERAQKAAQEAKFKEMVKQLRNQFDLLVAIDGFQIFRRKQRDELSVLRP